MMTNLDFIRAAFPKTPAGASAWVTGFAEDPHVAEPRRWHGRAIVGVLPWFIKPHTNNFFVISSFSAGPDGVVHRRKENFAACHVIMLDDIGTKIPEYRLELHPSYLFETSPGNHQAGYLLDPPETDRAKIERLLDELVRSGLAMDGADPGMRGVTRYARLPVGQNSKAKYVKRMGAPFVHQVVAWEPGQTYTVDEISEAYGLDLTPRVIPFRTARSEAPHWASGVLRRLSEAGLYIGPIGGRPGAHRVICPWCYTHTDNDNTGTAYFEPSPDNCMSGGFKCHHGHCQDRDIQMLIRFLTIYERRLREAAQHG
ncbi:MAG: RepB family DNA primase [Pseudomonadota bacterium]|nr:hypothetical protein [Gammaproteobacteria bacterium]MDQ3580497.1 RepB family DNA primase [Pseudomonadota bacterium]